MTNSTEEHQSTQSSNNTATITKPLLPIRNSSERHDLDSEKPVYVDGSSYKRGRHEKDDTVRCPIADFGCLNDIHLDDLYEHYTSKIHQECLMKVIEQYVRQIHSIPRSSALLHNQEDYSERENYLNVIAEGVSCLHDDNVQLHQHLVELQSTMVEQQNQIEHLKLSSEESRQFINAIQLNNNILQNDIEIVKRTVMDMSSQSLNDGSFIWKITNVAQKIDDSIAERQTSIYSPPFYSSPTGYKMCMRLYFNGDGQARRTHLSLFFVLMRGEYDALLSWPFSYKITFCLYDQTSAKRHIIDSFRPDIKSNSFQRPKSSMNIASGIPKFCPVTIIQQHDNPYIRDDSMFIRCIVEFTPTSKLTIPYMCNLNVGLPAMIQRTMMQAEIERLKSQSHQMLTDEKKCPPI